MPPAVVPAPGTKLSIRKARRDAAQYLIAEVERRPGEVTVLALGPMTNIAMALRIKPDIETKIKRIVMMGGAFRVPGNASPLAAADLLAPAFVNRFETRYLDVQSVWGMSYGSTVPLDRRVAPAATPVTFMLGLDFKRIFALYKNKLTRAD